MQLRFFLCSMLIQHGSIKIHKNDWCPLKANSMLISHQLAKNVYYSIHNENARKSHIEPSCLGCFAFGAPDPHATRTHTNDFAHRTSIKGYFHVYNKCTVWYTHCIPTITQFIFIKVFPFWPHLSSLSPPNYKFYGKKRKSIVASLGGHE